MAGVDIKYKGISIATIQGTGSKTLKTEGKYCEGDIVVDYTKEGITPSGTKNITSNGTHDVTQYASANVNVPTGITPSGSINITANGTYDVTDKASAVVAVQTGSQNSKCFKKTFESKITTNGWIYFNEADTDIAAHINDPTFVVTIMNITDFSVAAERNIAVTATNHIKNSFNSNYSYGMLLKAANNGVTGYGGVNKAVNVSTPASGGSQICVTSDGKIGIYNSAYTSWEAGTYVALCGW